MKQKYPWPLDEMFALYKSGKTVEDISTILSGPEWQPYWVERLGFEYHPGGKQVNGVLKREGCPMRPRGATNPLRHGSWKGGRTVDKHGYILVYQPHHPYATKKGKVREHRLVMEKMLGRFLLPNEVVHHIDDNPANNDPDNLQLFSTNAEHLAETLKGKCPNWSEEGRRRISRSKASTRPASEPGAPPCSENDFRLTA